MTERLKVLIADDQEYFRAWLKQLIQTNFPNVQTILETASAEESVALATSHKPDVVFMDIEFRNQPLHGIAAAERIWKRNPGAAVVICSAHSEVVYIRKLSNIVPEDATYGYVLKDQSVQRFVDACKAIFSSESWIDPEVNTIFRRPPNKVLDLTDSEYETIVLIALGFGDRFCAELLYLGEKAIQARLSKVYSKLGLPAKGTVDAGTFNNRCRSAWIALQKGLIDSADLRQHEIEIVRVAKSRGINIPISLPVE